MRKPTNPRSLTESERTFLAQEKPLLAEDLGFIADQIEQRLGYGQEEARGTVGWLALKEAGIPDRSSAKTRSKYRRILRELAESISPEPPHGRETDEAVAHRDAKIIALADRRGVIARVRALAGVETGGVSIAVCTAVAATGTGLAAHLPAVALAVLVPIITDSGQVEATEGILATAA